MYLTWLAAVARQTGYPVVEIPGWRTRGHGGMLGVLGVVNHWTAGPAHSSQDYPSLGVVRDGRPRTPTQEALPGPLANLGVGFSGKIYVVAAGSCYHAGTGSWHGVTTGNQDFVGIEVESPGGFIYTPAQKDCIIKLNAVLLNHAHRPVGWAIAHFEWAPTRKPDGPAQDMHAWRAKVALAMNPAPVAEEDWLSVATEAEYRKMVREEVRAELKYGVGAITGLNSNTLYDVQPDLREALAEILAAIKAAA